MVEEGILLEEKDRTIGRFLDLVTTGAAMKVSSGVELVQHVAVTTIHCSSGQPAQSKTVYINGRKRQELDMQ